MTYHITFKGDARPVTHTSLTWPITMRSLVAGKCDELLKQEIIVLVTQATDWVSSLSYSWKVNGKLGVFFDPEDIMLPFSMTTTSL